MPTCGERLIAAPALRREFMTPFWSRCDDDMVLTLPRNSLGGEGEGNLGESLFGCLESHQR